MNKTLLAPCAALILSVLHGPLDAAPAYQALPLPYEPDSVRSITLGERGHLVVSVSGSPSMYVHGPDGTVSLLPPLGTSPRGYGDSVAYGVNAAGQVAGHSSYFASGVYGGSRAAMWSQGRVTYLGDFGHDRWGEAYGVARFINARGQVAGDAYTYNTSGDVENYSTGFLWSEGRRVQLAGFSGATAGISARIEALNVHGQIAGNVGWSDGETHYSKAVIWDSHGVPTALPGPDSRAISLNDAGRAVGVAWGSEGGARGLLWRDGAAIDLGHLWLDGHGNSWIEPVKINNRQQVLVQASKYVNGEPAGYRAALWEAGVLREIDASAVVGHDGRVRPIDLNGAGHVVAASTVALVSFDGRSFQDLNRLVDTAALAGWTLREPTQINDAGQIVVRGWHDATGRSSYFLLTPVPEPSKGLMLGLGLFATVRRGRRPLAFGPLRAGALLRGVVPLLLLAGGSVSAGENLLRNGEFEERRLYDPDLYWPLDVPEHWDTPRFSADDQIAGGELFQNAVLWSDKRLPTADGRPDPAVWMFNAAAFGQAFTVTEAGHYRLRWTDAGTYSVRYPWEKSIPFYGDEHRGQRYAVQLGDQLLGEYQAVHGQADRWHELDLTLTPGTHSLSFAGLYHGEIERFGGSNQYARQTVVYFAAFDNVSVTAMPEPGTWALVGLGLLGLAGASRRRRHSCESAANGAGVASRSD
ncbi:PEP-CTERM sorting domain-containing protein [Caldimonas brevitalea]|uniref:Ice-binding protein C-terminal domain-containing protein n=1 Tax=Caldimonas brevitalea TaxID=413882 RepID=A0A0G3BQM1_9BURK|nr:PEP-CTERM sorting domain-containing protein [Caldimonas brevitalea]AKJ31742.1 hypothetical protein AAW51_5051 [Caldimonas brevitalea]